MKPITINTHLDFSNNSKCSLRYILKATARSLESVLFGAFSVNKTSLGNWLSVASSMEETLSSLILEETLSSSILCVCVCVFGFGAVGGFGAGVDVDVVRFCVGGKDKEEQQPLEQWQPPPEQQEQHSTTVSPVMTLLSSMTMCWCYYSWWWDNQ